MIELVYDFQLHLLYQDFLRRREANYFRARFKTAHMWIWDMMLKFGKMNMNCRNSVHERMVGDLADILGRTDLQINIDDALELFENYLVAQGQGAQFQTALGQLAQ